MHTAFLAFFFVYGFGAIIHFWTALYYGWTDIGNLVAYVLLWPIWFVRAVARGARYIWNHE